jgi:hypothetical protein
MLGSDAQNIRVIGIDWKEFVLDAMATTVCYPHQMHLGKNKGSKYNLLFAHFNDNNTLFGSILLLIII